MPTSQYATRSDLTTLGISASALVSVSTGDQDSALQAASELADSYLGNRFELPLTLWGMDLRRCVCTIAAYDLMRVRGFNPEAGDAEVFRDDYKDAIRWLEKVAKGEVTPINVVDSDSTGANQTDTAQKQPEPHFVYTSSDPQSVAPGFWGPEQAGFCTPKKRGW